MGLNLIEKILRHHTPGRKLEDFIYAKVDFSFANDITGPLAVQEFYKTNLNRVFRPSRVAFVCDHFTPARDFKSANNVARLREFSKKFRIKNFFDINNCGIEHVFLLEKGLVKPSDLIVGADSHTCTYGAIGAAAFGVGSTDLAGVMATGRCWFRVPKTIKFIYKGRLKKWVGGKDVILFTIGKIGVDGALYKVMEFSGPLIRRMDMEGRFTLCNMAVEAGAKTGIIEADETTLSYLKKIGVKVSRDSILTSDKKAFYLKVYEWDLSFLRPQVSCPHLPSNVQPAASLSKVKLDQVVIGSCTNGRLKDLEIAARILKSRKVKSNLRVIIIPATPRIYKEAYQRGYIKIFTKAGCIISPSTCGPCLGGHMGILAQGEVALATTNRNFIGRMGHPLSAVYLSGPAVAAASAVTGRITDPEEVA